MVNTNRGHLPVCRPPPAALCSSIAVLHLGHVWLPEQAVGVTSFATCLANVSSRCLLPLYQHTTWRWEYSLWGVFKSKNWPITPYRGFVIFNITSSLATDSLLTELINYNNTKQPWGLIWHHSVLVCLWGSSSACFYWPKTGCILNGGGVLMMWRACHTVPRTTSF